MWSTPHVIHPTYSQQPSKRFHLPSTQTRVFLFNFEKMDKAVLQEAADALDSQEFTSERAIVRHFNMKRSTLQHQKSSVLPRNKAFQKF
jgi:hypothetical protein